MTEAREAEPADMADDVDGAAAANGSSVVTVTTAGTTAVPDVVYDVTVAAFASVLLLVLFVSVEAIVESPGWLSAAPVALVESSRLVVAAVSDALVAVVGVAVLVVE